MSDVSDIYFHSGKNFHPGKDIVVYLRRKIGDVLKNSVQSIAQTDAVLLRFKMDITSLHFYGAGHDDVYHLRRGYFGDSFFEVNDISQIFFKFREVCSGKCQAQVFQIIGQSDEFVSLQGFLETGF